MMMRRFLLIAAALGVSIAVTAHAFAPLQAPLEAPTQTPTQTPTPPPAAESAPGMPAWIEKGIEDYGAITLFGAFVISGVGLHLSEDLILIPAGWIAAHDLHTFLRFWLWAYLGIVAGDSLWFWMCGTFGTRFLHSKWFKRVLHPRRLLEVKHQIDARGALVLLAARFVPGTRTPVITMCGLLHMKWWKFLLVELTCTALTVPLQMLVGVLGARAAKEAGFTDITHQLMIGIAFTIAFVMLMYFGHLWWTSRRSKLRAKRAPARWLRLYQATKRLVIQAPKQVGG